MSKHRSHGKRRSRRQEWRLGEERTWRSDLESVMCLVAAVIVGIVGYLVVSDMYLLEHRGEVVSATVLDSTPSAAGQGSRSGS